jgi:hypothetical protein
MNGWRKECAEMRLYGLHRFICFEAKTTENQEDSPLPIIGQLFN